MTSPTDTQAPSEVIRNFAVEIVDGIRGFTMEFAGSPNEHRLMYDHIETRVTELAASLDAQSAERTRAEVEKMRERAARKVDAASELDNYDGHPFSSDMVELLETAATAIRNLPIEGTSP